MTIKVTNNSDHQIKVAINHWASDGNTGYFTLDNGKSESWDRSDERGFVMVVKRGAAQRPYYVQYNSEIAVLPEKITDNGSDLKPIA